MPLRDMDREQMWLSPPSLDELLPLDHPARFVAEFVDALDKDDWAELCVDIEGDPLGAPAYHPRALLSVWLYGFMSGVRSCRKLETACRDQIPYLWLTGWQHPDHNTLWRFYKEHRQSMRKLFERTVHTAVTMKLLDLAVQAVDGTKVSANASVYRTHNAEELRQLLSRVEAAIRDLEAQNEAGEDTASAHLPRELANKEMLREQVRQAMADLERKERQKRINLTDGDARLAKSGAPFLSLSMRQTSLEPLLFGTKSGVPNNARGQVEGPASSIAERQVQVRKVIVRYIPQTSWYAPGQLVPAEVKLFQFAKLAQFRRDLAAKLIFVKVQPYQVGQVA